MQNSTDFWADLDQVCLCSQELTERLEMEKGNQEIQATVFVVFFFSLQDVPVKMGANSQSKILPQHSSMKARKRNHPKESNQQLLWSPWYEHGKMIIVDQPEDQTATKKLQNPPWSSWKIRVKNTQHTFGHDFQSQKSLRESQSPTASTPGSSGGTAKVASGHRICLLGSEPQAASGSLCRGIWLQTCQCCRG